MEGAYPTLGAPGKKTGLPMDFKLSNLNKQNEAYDAALLLMESGDSFIDPTKGSQQMTESQAMYARLKSTRQRDNYLGAQKKKRGFSPPLKLNLDRQHEVS